MKPTSALCSAVITAILLISSPSFAGGDNDVLYQVSAAATLEGDVIEGQEYISDLIQHGGFGIGSFEGADEELVVLDGSFYHADSDGTVKEVDHYAKIPFACLTFFETDLSWKIHEQVDLGMLEDFLDKMLPDDGLIYAIKVTGSFVSVDMPQVKPVVPRLYGTEGAMEDNHQGVIGGTLVGFRIPSYMGRGLSVPGYHFHFINNGRTYGGRVTDCRMMSVEVEADATNQLYVALPEAGFTMPVHDQDEGVDESDAAEGRDLGEGREPVKKSVGDLIEEQTNPE